VTVKLAFYKSHGSRSALSVIADIALLLGATFAALLIRENLYISSARFAELVPYFGATLLAGIVVYPASSISRGIWRFSALPDYRNVALAAALAVFVATALTFSWNRLEHVARSLPILQFFFAVVFQVGARVAFRTWRTHRSARRRGSPLQSLPVGDRLPVLLVGLNRLAEVYLQSVEDLARERIAVIGLLGQRDRHVGRMVAATPVLGLPEDIATVLRDLEPHGTDV